MSATETATEPPSYVPPGENTAPSLSEIPDDFKYSDVVAECDVEIRQRFMQRVYLLLAVQVAATLGLSYVGSTWAPWLNWTMAHPNTLFIPLIGTFVALTGVVVWGRRYPWNLAFLAVFTAFESWILGFLCSMFDTATVLNALFMSIVVFVGLSLFATQTRYDFSGWAPYLCTLLFGLLGLGFVAMFTNSETVSMAYSFIAVALFSVYIVVDTQLIMNKVHPDDVVHASLTLYLDLVNIFVNLLRLLQGSN